MPVEPLILAIESSCDDTSAAVLRGNKVLSNIVASQKIHQKYGGVVPELASRAHQQNIIPVVSVALEEANIDYTRAILFKTVVSDLSDSDTFWLDLLNPCFSF